MNLNAVLGNLDLILFVAGSYLSLRSTRGRINQAWSPVWRL